MSRPARIVAGCATAVACGALATVVVALGGCGLGTQVPQAVPNAAPGLPSTAPPTSAGGGVPQFGSGGLIVFDGDSLTWGTGAARGSDYPTDVMKQLPKELDGVNLAVPGQVWRDLLNDADRQVDPLYSAQRPHNIVVVWAGTNDLLRGSTAGQVWQDLARYCADRRARGWQVVVLTVLATVPPDVYPQYDAERRALNDTIRKHWKEVADALADVAADERIGDPAGQGAAQYSTDGVHHNAAGYQVVADCVVRTLRSLIAK